MKLDADPIKAAANLGEIAGRYMELKKNGTTLVTHCPFHADKSPSFTVTPARNSWHCFGCGKHGDVFDLVGHFENIPDFSDRVQRVADMIGMTVYAPPEVKQAEGKIVAMYRYEDESGETLYEICRIEPGKHGKKKDFVQRYRGEDGQWIWKKHPRQVLYHFTEIAAAVTVYLVEGEKDADTLVTHGWVATTNAGGTGAPWLPAFTDTLRGKRVVIFPDNDEAGRKAAEAKAKAITGTAAEVHIVPLPVGEKCDVTDYLQAGHSIADLEALVEIEIRESAKARLLDRGLLSPSEAIEVYDGGFSAFMDPSTLPKGIQTGFTLYDNMTLGLHPGELIIIAARPAMGKTALMLNIAAFAAKAQRKVSIFSLEMSRISLLTRLLCATARVDSQRHRHGYLNVVERSQVRIAWSEIEEWPLYIDDSSNTDLNLIRKRCRWRKENGGLDLAIIDYLQLMSGGKAKENRTQEVSAFSRGLKLLARELNIPIIALSQLSRAPEQRANPRPQLSDLRESGSIEQDADVVNFIFREEEYKKDREDLKGRAELIVSKHRNGPTGIIPLVWIAGLTRFENFAYEVSYGQAEMY